jgi:hypothetical protein
LVDEAEEVGEKFDYVDNWNACVNKEVGESLDLLRFLFTMLFHSKQ